MSNTLQLIYDKTLKVISDLLRVKHAAIFTLDNSSLVLRRRLTRGKPFDIAQSFHLSGELRTIIAEQKESALVDESFFENSEINEILPGQYYYYFPCLNSKNRVIALLLISVLDKATFNIENYSLIHVVGQRLAVEIEKNNVKKERNQLSAFNAMIISSLDEVTLDYRVKDNTLIWQGAILNVLGKSKDALSDQLSDLIRSVHRSDRDILEGYLTQESPFEGKFTYEFQYEIEPKIYRWLRLEGIGLKASNNEPDRTIAVLKNIHQDKMADLNRLSTLIQAKDGERRRIAGEIHDSLGQILSVVRLELDNLNDMIGNKVISSKLSLVTEMVVTALTESRAISHDLMPPALEDYGLVDGLELMIKQVNSSSIINFNYLQNNIVERFDDKLETNVYRICQEAVNNIIKHSQAKNATIQLVRHSDSLFISIEDDGIGLSGRVTGKGKGLGISNMQNRVANIGGKMEVEGGDGLMITIEILFNETENIIGR